MSDTNPGKVRAFTTPATNIKQLKTVTLGEVALQEPSAVAFTGGSIHGPAVSSGASQEITKAGAVSVDVNYVDIIGPAESTYAITLDVPSRVGQVLILEMTDTTGTSAVTMALTNVVGGTNGASASFDAAGEALVLLSVGSKWLVIKEYGVTLAGA